MSGGRYVESLHDDDVFCTVGRPGVANREHLIHSWCGVTLWLCELWGLCPLGTLVFATCAR